jgi:triosephosphate isomerase
MRTPLIAGNWKMNGGKAMAVPLVDALLRALRAHGPVACDLLVCPPAPLIATLAPLVAHTPVALGGQDCHPDKSGAHTGDIAAEMLADAGAGYVIVGHSERRQDHGEDDALVRAKAAAALRADLVAVICVGETEAQRDAGKALDVVRAQLAGSLPKGADQANTVIAYEPVWAIGTGRTPTVEEVAEIHGGIRAALAGHSPLLRDCRVLYGGSMKPDNAAALLAVEDVDGGLIGGASLSADDFWAIAAVVA